MTRAKVVRVVVFAGGLGTRIAGWARYIPRSSTRWRAAPEGHGSYLHAARLPAAALPTAGPTVSFITQHGPYADMTSVLNGASYLASREDLYVVFADNLYRGNNPLPPSGPPRPATRPSSPALTSESWRQAGA